MEVQLSILSSYCSLSDAVALIVQGLSSTSTFAIDNTTATEELLALLRDHRLVAYSGHERLFSHQLEGILELCPSENSIVTRSAGHTRRVGDIRLYPEQIREAIAAAVAELVPERAAPTSAAETQCKAWLIRQMAANRASTRPKSEYEKEARETFKNLGHNSFIRAWDAAKGHTGRGDFGRAGRKPKQKSCVSAP